jgi:predicted transcriptional regulator of viral defense system
MARSRDLEREGISRSDLRRLTDEGLVERIGHGLYKLPGVVLTEKHSLAQASRLVPRGVVCLLSALRFHELTTQNPPDVWMAIRAKAWRPKPSALRIRLVHMSQPLLEQGVETHDVGGVDVRVTSPARTVADCFKFRNKIGIDVAVEALRDFTRRHRGGAHDLSRFARLCRVSRVMQPYLDSLE